MRIHILRVELILQNFVSIEDDFNNRKYNHDKCRRNLNNREVAKTHWIYVEWTSPEDSRLESIFRSFRESFRQITMDWFWSMAAQAKPGYLRVRLSFLPVWCRAPPTRSSNIPTYLRA